MEAAIGFYFEISDIGALVYKGFPQWDDNDRVNFERVNELVLLSFDKSSYHMISVIDMHHVREGLS